MTKWHIRCPRSIKSSRKTFRDKARLLCDRGRQLSILYRFDGILGSSNPNWGDGLQAAIDHQEKGLSHKSFCASFI
ncbi:MAG: hypothetical protein ACI4XL_02040 [Bacillus sp. (in: firmicutes)]